MLFEEEHTLQAKSIDEPTRLILRSKRLSQLTGQILLH